MEDNWTRLVLDDGDELLVPASWAWLISKPVVLGTATFVAYPGDGDVGGGWVNLAHVVLAESALHGEE